MIGIGKGIENPWKRADWDAAPFTVGGFCRSHIYFG